MSYFLPSPFAPPNSPLNLFRRTQTPIYSALPSNSFIAIMYLGYSYGSGERLQQQPHFLDACFLCHKPLPSNSDIFMYRGNTPFCSKECRQEQIEVDESSEMMTATAWKKKKKKSLLPSSSANSSTRSAVTSPSSASTKAVRTGTVAVA